MMHFALFWGTDSANVILFGGWPGASVGKYVFLLIVIFLGGIITEWLAFLKVKWVEEKPYLSGFLSSLVYGIRMFFANMMMLSLMSFNIGVVILAVLGHGVGYWLFGTCAFRKKACDRPPLPN
ncbi:copper transporter 6-like [Nymphaea colorata]|uniref:copper transporter 6-like n=1 Tax=Nymphaea colorata TaxID=210225 RepID=UPI00129E9CD7|nr:copper transporter 6-like [Nymphaea colorata]